MRNLKRALSLALASVMLLGMMVVGSSAANFTDADKINNDEAVAIAAGLGIFDGYEDGSFGPEKVVTRAEAAVVIAKILHGADIDPTNFAGAGKFTDVPAWAEGWVNLVSSLGIIVGYGDGKFGPNDEVTTVQFATMLLKALGYYTADDALGTDWALTVTSKATALGLYGDMALAMNEGLTRENVAEMTFNALFAQRVAYDDYRGLYVKANDRNVVVTNGTDDADNTLAQNTFGLYAVEGIVVDNGMTNADLAATLKADAQTTVMFTEETDLNQDGKAEYDVDDTYNFEVETDLDMIGHAAKVYYKLVKKAPVVFAVVDMATLVVEMDYAANTTNFAKAANNAGFKKNTILDVDTDKYIVNYDMETTYDEMTGSDAFALDKLVVISNSADMTVDYVIALDQYLDNIADYDDEEDEYALEIANGTELNIVAEAMDEDDYVVVTNIGKQDEILVVEAAKLVEGDLTKINGTSGGTRTVTSIIVDGETYKKSTVDASDCTANFVEFADIETIGTVTLVMDKWGKVMGLANEDATINYAYIAQFGTVHSTGTLNTSNKLTAHIYFADGTNGIYQIDNPSFFTDKGYANKDAMNGTGADYYVADGAAKGLYNVTIKANGKAKVADLVIDAPVADDDAISLKTGLSTLLYNAGTDSQSYVADNGYTLLNNNDTVYFYVTGVYDDNLDVDVITGIKNAIAFKTDVDAEDVTIDVDNNTYGTGIREAFYTVIKQGKVHTDRAAIDAMLVQGIVVDGTDVYYYNKDYTVTKGDDDYVVTFKLWDNKTGEAAEVSYDGFSSEANAKAHAEATEIGFYTIGAANLKDKWTESDGMGWSSNTYYIVNDTAVYDEYTDNLQSYLNNVGSITESTTIVDVCNSGLNSIAKIAKAIKTYGDGSVKLSYTYNNKYNTSILFVCSYNPKATEAPNASVAAQGIDEVDMTSGVVTVTLKDLTFDGTKKMSVVLYEYSRDLGAWIDVYSENFDVVFTDGVSATIDVSSQMITANRYFVTVAGEKSNTEVF